MNKIGNIATIEAILKSEGSALDNARKDRKRFNLEVSAAKILRKSISDQLSIINAEIRLGKAGHRQKTLAVTRNFLKSQYQELLISRQAEKFQRIQLNQFIDDAVKRVHLVDQLWEASKLQVTE